MDVWDWLNRRLYALQRSGSPLSLILVGVVVAFFLIGWLISGSEGGRELVRLLAYDPSFGWHQPWRMVSYALLNFNPWELLFVVFSLYFFGTSIERRWGVRRFGWFLFLQVLAFPCVFWLYFVFSGSSDALALTGMDLPACSLLVAWGSLYPFQQVLLWFVLPVRGAWIGWISGLLPVFFYGWGRPILGFLVGVPFGLVWAYVAGRFPLVRIPRRRGMGRGADYEGRDWERLREVEEERRRLKEFFERSWREEEGEDGTKPGE